MNGLILVIIVENIYYVTLNKGLNKKVIKTKFIIC